MKWFRAWVLKLIREEIDKEKFAAYVLIKNGDVVATGTFLSHRIPYEMLLPEIRAGVVDARAIPKPAKIDQYVQTQVRQIFTTLQPLYVYENRSPRP